MPAGFTVRKPSVRANAIFEQYCSYGRASGVLNISILPGGFPTNYVRPLPLILRTTSSAPQVERAIPFPLGTACDGCGRLCHGNETPALIRYKIVSRPRWERPEHRQIPQRP